MRSNLDPWARSLRSPGATLVVVALALLACKKDEEPEVQVVPVAAAPAPAPQAPAGSPATIQAGSNPSGGQRRGIVRSAPRFGATEVSRLSNGSAIRISRRESGGWLFISFKTQSGYIHKDVVSEGGTPSANQ